MIEVAAMRLAAARREASRTLSGIVVNASVKAAMRLILGHLFENREGVVAGVTVAEVPMGVYALLRPYRRVMMP